MLAYMGTPCIGKSCFLNFALIMLLALPEAERPNDYRGHAVVFCAHHARPRDSHTRYPRERLPGGAVCECEPWAPCVTRAQSTTVCPRQWSDTQPRGSVRSMTRLTKLRKHDLPMPRTCRARGCMRATVPFSPIESRM